MFPGQLGEELLARLRSLRDWVTIPGTDAANTYSTVIRATNAAVFFRLVSP